MTDTVLSFDGKHEIEIQRIVKKGGFKGKAEFFTYATNLFLWAIEQIEAGRQIRSHDPKNNVYFVVCSEQLTVFEPFNDNEPE